MVDLTTDQIDERCRVGARWFLDGEGHTVSEIRAHQHRWLVSFDGISDRTGAESLAGRVISADPIEGSDALWVHELVGSVVVDQTGVRRGTVVAVLANPAHPIIELDSGQLVPTVFVVSCVDGITTVDVPDGLFDL
jgi:16S rRNA processing protein RimM